MPKAYRGRTQPSSPDPASGGGTDYSSTVCEPAGGTGAGVDGSAAAGGEEGFCKAEPSTLTLSLVNNWVQETRSADDHFGKTDKALAAMRASFDTLDEAGTAKQGKAAAEHAAEGEKLFAGATLDRLYGLQEDDSALIGHPKMAEAHKARKEARLFYDTALSNAPSAFVVDSYKGKPFNESSAYPPAAEEGQLASHINAQLPGQKALFEKGGEVKRWGDKRTSEWLQEQDSFWDTFQSLGTEWRSLVGTYKGGEWLWLFGWLQDSNAIPQIPQALGQDNRDAMRQLEAMQSRWRPVRSAVRDMGMVKAMDAAFYKVAGGILDGLLPGKGDKAKLQLNLNVPIAAGGAVSVGLFLESEAEREDTDKVKFGVKVGAVLTGQFKAWVFKAFVQAKLYGFVEAVGDDGRECFELIGLALYKRVDKVSSKLANAIFSESVMDNIVRRMDENDSVESGFGVGLRAGFGSADGSGGEAGAEVQSGTLLKKSGGYLLEYGTRKETRDFAFNVKGKGGGGKIEQKWIDGEWASTEYEGMAEIDLDATEITGALVGGEIATQVVRLIAQAIQGNLGMQKDSDSRKLASLGKAVSGLTAGQLGMGKGVAAAAARLGSMPGVTVGLRIVGKAKYEAGKGGSFELSINRTQKIQFGENPRSMVYLLLENMQRIVQVKKQLT